MTATDGVVYGSARFSAALDGKFFARGSARSFPGSTTACQQARLAPGRRSRDLVAARSPGTAGEGEGRDSDRWSSVWQRALFRRARRKVLRSRQRPRFPGRRQPVSRRGSRPVADLGTLSPREAPKPLVKRSDSDR